MTSKKTNNQQDMKNTMTKWLSAIALISCFACSKAELGTDNATLLNENESGVFGAIDPIIDEDAAGTRAYVTTGWGYKYEVGDRINIWSNTGSLLAFRVTKLIENGKRAEFSNSGFTLTQGEMYYATHPFVNDMEADYTALPITFDGQTQTLTSDGKLKDLAKYLYTWTSAPCEPVLDGEGNQQLDEHGNPKTQTSFQFHYLPTFLDVNATLPKAMTVTEISLKADDEIFALNGLMNVEDGSFTPVGDLVNTLSMKSLNVQVTSDNLVLRAFFASAPLPAAKYTVIIKDNQGKTYSSPEIDVEARTGGFRKTINVTVESDEKNYKLVTSTPSDAAGKYILVYPNGTTYRAFSFTKAMENAEAAGELAKDTHGLENILAMGSQLYATVVANNCIDVEGPANAESLILTPDQEKEAAFDVSLLDADHAWDLVDGKVTLSATTQKGKSYSIGVDHAVVNVNGNADVVVAFNAPDVINAMKAIRGTDLPVDFDYLINLAVAQAMKEGITFTSAQIARLKSGFEHLCTLAKSMVASHPEVFQGGTLMDINLSTNVFDVVGRYYDNATQMSWSIAPEKRFGLATLGYHAYDKGFTFNVGLPQAGWFNRLEESLKYDADNDHVLEAEDCVAYWKQFDSQYNLGIDKFFERASRRALSELDPTTLAMLQQMAAAGKFAAIGNVYKQYADRFNDELEPVYIYKKVE